MTRRVCVSKTALPMAREMLSERGKWLAVRYMVPSTIFSSSMLGLRARTIRASAILSRQGTATTFMTAGATLTGSSDSPSTPDDLYIVYTACGQSVVDVPSGKSKEKAGDATSIVDLQPCNQT